MLLKVDRELDRCTRVMRQRLAPKIDRVVGTCTVRSHQIPGEPVPSSAFFEQVCAGTVDFQPLGLGQTWGTTWGTTWMEVEGRIDPAHMDDNPLELIVDLGWQPDSPGGHYEAEAYRPDGSIIKAINPKNRWIPLDGRDLDGLPTDEETSVIRPDGSFTLYLEAACNPLILGVPPFVETRLGEGTTGRADEPSILTRLDVCHFDHAAWNYYLDLEVVCQLIRESKEDSPRYWRLGKALQRSLNIYEERDLSTIEPARRALAAELALPAVPSSLDHAVVGHSHIDSAWLWPKRETRRKVARTVSNILALMERDPKFIYAMSSPQQYAWLQEDHPDLFARLRRRVEEGRFIPVGGMWVESDGMLPAGESLTRQFTYGKRWLRENLGVDTDIVWEPDSFGYTGQFPQIARRAGMNYFLSQKISWNDTTKFPHHTFDWEGVDGTSIFTHFPPMDTYASTMTARELNHSEENYRDKDISTRALVLCGYGDGGGGTTREMLGRYDRLHDVEGAARVRYETPEDFFDESSREIHAKAGAEMPVWRGELYLELHRKTLTSQQDMKKGCRQEEAMLRTVEYLCSYACLASPAYTYPKQELDRIWQTLLLNQFHDILPGSAISWVHRLAREDYRRDIARLRQIGQEAAGALAEAAPSPGLVAGAIVNPMGGEKGDWEVVEADPMPLEAAAVSLVGRPDGSYTLDNGLIRAAIGSDGEVHSLVDARSGRDLVPAGSSMGGYELLRDEPAMWDAWDLERDALLSAVKVPGPVRIDPLDDGVSVVRQDGDTCITTRITLKPGARRLDFEATVDWHEDEQVLKVDLPLSVQARYAQFECQYGFIDRPIQKNNEAEEAQFESCTHRFVRVRDDALAVGVVNASTYGADTTPIPDDPAAGRQGGTMIRLTLLSSPVYPDPDTDRGRHDFAWSVVPCEDQNEVLRQAYRLNAPVFAGGLPQVEPLVSVESLSGRLVIDWVKMADDGSGDLIARLYDPDSSPAVGCLHLAGLLEGASVRETNSLEDAPLPSDLRHGLRADGEVKAEGAPLDFAPFQFTTLRFHRR
ncbi:alpha-mannosidase [Bifidobacterium favimelis]|uniref:Glycoside hydrolase family 38 C-terminal domain-containing protein n=1 Tax=Bifidobacterium favimelis TaxID=3122979 RepID=A0ABU8ZQV5_9BIFI